MSRRRLLTAVRMGTDSVRIYRDREYDCYTIVVAYTNPLNGTVHRCECEESSLQAARGTAAAECRWIRRNVASARKGVR